MIGELRHDAIWRSRVIPLAFHVDYWNHLGWRDPYSSHRWSQRQRDYARVLKVESVYTPQIVIDGRRQIVGSDRRALLEAVERASWEQPQARLSIDGPLVRGTSPVPLDLYTAETGDEASTVVGRGENGGRTLRNDAVVKGLKRVATVHGQFEQKLAGANVAFLQDPATLRIYAAATTR